MADTSNEQGEITSPSKTDSSGDAKMAESKPAAEDAADGTMIASGEVTYNGKAHQLLLMQKGLRLVASEQDSKASAQGADVPVLDVPWREVVCACEPPVKKSKSAVGAKKPEMADPATSKTFVVHYMVRNAKTFKVQCKSVTLESTQDTAESWIVQIEEKRKEGKPQKLLIIINPIGGQAKGRQLFAKRVQPLFVLAGVELVVKVTERAQHAIEMAKTFDVASVDGVVVMGGDGMYMEVLHALTVRKQEEEGVDYNDPEATLVPPTVRIGIIPAGTGNGLAACFNGVMDLETATLNIIRGETDRANMFAIHEGRKLVQYAGLLFANGFFSSLIKRTQDLRWMRTARYPYVMLSHIFGKKKVLDFEIEVLKGEEDQEKKEEGAKAEEGAEAASASGWVKVGTRQATSVCAVMCRLMAGPDGLFAFNPFRPNFDLLLLNCTTTADIGRFLYGFYTHKMSSLERPYVERVQNVRGAKIRHVPSPAEGARGQTENELLCKMLDVDGEIVPISHAQFEVRMYSQFLHVFAFSEHYNQSATPSS